MLKQIFDIFRANDRKSYKVIYKQVPKFIIKKEGREDFAHLGILPSIIAYTV